MAPPLLSGEDIMYFIKKRGAPRLILNFLFPNLISELFRFLRANQSEPKEILPSALAVGTCQMMPFTFYGLRAFFLYVFTSPKITNCKVGNTAKIGAIN